MDSCWHHHWTISRALTKRSYPRVHSSDDDSSFSVELFIIIHSPHRFIKLSLVCRNYNHSVPRPNLISTPARTGTLACMACSQTPSRCEPRIHTSAPLELPVYLLALYLSLFFIIFFPLFLFFFPRRLGKQDSRQIHHLHSHSHEHTHEYILSLSF